MTHEDFCSFKYQRLPRMKNSFDISVLGLNPINIRYVSSCVMKTPKQGMGPISMNES